MQGRGQAASYNQKPRQHANTKAFSHYSHKIFMGNTELFLG